MIFNAYSPVSLALATIKQSPSEAGVAEVVGVGAFLDDDALEQ